MRIEALVQKRLDELARKGQAIAAARSSEVLTHSGRTIEYINVANAKGWGTSALSLLRQSFGESSIHAQQFQTAFDNLTEFYSSFTMVSAIFASAKDDYEGGYIFSLRGLVKAEVLTDALEQAMELLRSSYKDPACVLVGVSLEIAVKELASRHSIAIRKLDRMNADLCKAGAYNSAKQAQVTAWAALRNKAAHGDWVAYTDADVREMHAGVQRFVADYL